MIHYVIQEVIQLAAVQARDRVQISNDIRRGGVLRQRVSRIQTPSLSEKPDDTIPSLLNKLIGHGKANAVSSCVGKMKGFQTPSA